MRKVFYTVILLFIVIVITSAFILYTGNDKNTSSINQVDETKISMKQSNNTNPSSSDELSSHDYFVQKMSEIGLRKDFIEKVFACNDIVFTSWYNYNRDKLDRQIGAFSSLKEKDDLQQRLLNMPEMSTLVAAVAGSKENGVEYAKAIIDSFQVNSADNDTIRSLYYIYCTPHDASQFARILTHGNNKKYIVELFQKNMGDLSFMCIFELLDKTLSEDSEAGEVYQKWLYTLLDEMMEMDPESDGYDNNYILIISQSEQLVEHLKSNKEFCRNFFAKYWGDFQKVLQSIPDDEYYEVRWLNYVNGDNLWKFIIEYPENGLKLIELYGDFAPYFLLQDEIVDNPKVKERLENLMLVANKEQQQAFMQISPEALPLYIKFLQRNFDNATVMTATIVMVNADYLGSSSSSKKKLEYWDKLSDEALLRDDDFTSGEVTLISFLPMYDATVLVWKYIDGREVTTCDMVMAGLDTAFTALTVVEIATIPVTGGGSVVAVEGIKTAGKTATKQAVKVAARTGAKIVTRQATKQMVKDAGKRATVATIKASRKVARKEWISLIKSYSNKLGKVDITSKVQSVFRNSHIGNQSFKKITGMDARIFMRSDRRVYIDLKGPIKNSIGVKIVEELTNDVFYGAVGYTVLTSSPAKNTILVIREELVRSAKARTAEECWKSDLSAWWMLSQYD